MRKQQLCLIRVCLLVGNTLWDDRGSLWIFLCYGKLFIDHRSSSSWELSLGFIEPATFCLSFSSFSFSFSFFSITDGLHRYCGIANCSVGAFLDISFLYSHGHERFLANGGGRRWNSQAENDL